MTISFFICNKLFNLSAGSHILLDIRKHLNSLRVAIKVLLLEFLSLRKRFLNIFIQFPVDP